MRLRAFESSAGALTGKRERLQKYRWSSYPSYLQGKQKRELWLLRCDRLFAEHGLMKESRRSRLEFARRMEHRRVEPNNSSAERIRRGWSFGGQDFIARLLDRLPGSVSEHHHTRERNQTLEWAVLRKSRSLLVRQRNDASIRAKGRSNAGEKLIATLRLDEKSCRSRRQRFPAHNSIVVCSQDNDPRRR
jgi:hypothetical protein